MTLKCLGRNQHDNNKLEQSLCANRAVSEHSGTCMHARTRTQTNAHTHTQMQTQTQTHTHAHPNAHNLALTCTHTYTHAHQSVHAPKLLMVRVSAVFKPSKCKHTHNLTLTLTHTHILITHAPSHQTMFGVWLLLRGSPMWLMWVLNAPPDCWHVSPTAPRKWWVFGVWLYGIII